MDKREKLDSLYNFLEENHPGYGECMLCKTFYKENKTRYLLIEKMKASNGDIFTVNSSFWWDYTFLWDNENPWEILFKSKNEKL